jgi:hypothetical protein
MTAAPDPRTPDAAKCASCNGTGLYPNEVPGIGTEWVGCPDCDHQPDAPTREGVTEEERADLWSLFEDYRRGRFTTPHPIIAAVKRIAAAHETVAWDAGAEAGFDSHAPDDLTDVQSRNPYRGAR